MNFHQITIPLCRVSEIQVQMLRLILCSFFRVSGNWNSLLLWVILFYRLQKVCKIANKISNEPFVYTVLGCLLCKYHFPHSFSYLLNGLGVYFTVVPCHQLCIQKCGIIRCSNMQLWHCRTDWLLLEIHRSTNTSDRPHCNFLQATCGIAVHNYALGGHILFRISRSILVGEIKMPKDIISTLISGCSAEDFVVNPRKKQNVLVSGLPMQSS